MYKCNATPSEGFFFFFFTFYLIKHLHELYFYSPVASFGTEGKVNSSIRPGPGFSGLSRAGISVDLWLRRWRNSKYRPTFHKNMTFGLCVLAGTEFRFRAIHIRYLKKNKFIRLKWIRLNFEIQNHSEAYIVIIM